MSEIDPSVLLTTVKRLRTSYHHSKVAQREMEKRVRIATVAYGNIRVRT